MDDSGWDEYVNGFHDTHPGITEAGLGHAVHPELGTPYQWLAGALPVDAGDVVDLACGSCPMQPLMTYSSYLGIDRNAAELEAAIAAGRGPVRRGDVTSLDLPDAAVDTAVMSMALMLVPLELTLAKVRRVLRPGGIFAAMVPTMWPVAIGDAPAVIALSIALHGPGSMPRTLTARTLRARLYRAGFSSVRLERQRFPFPIHSTDQARLAVTSLYTPGRSARQLQRAQRWLTRLTDLPGPTQLPVPLLRVIAR